MGPELKHYPDTMRSDFKAGIERVETALLTAFHSWASPTEARLRTRTAALRAIDLELESMNDRLQRVEGKK